MNTNTDSNEVNVVCFSPEDHNFVVQFDEHLSNCILFNILFFQGLVAV
jgi:hypothetical protein